MIVDTSALLAVLFREAEAPRFEALIAASSCRMSVANVLEAALVVEGRGGRQAGDALDEFRKAHGGCAVRGADGPTASSASVCGGDAPGRLGELDV